VEIRNRVDDFYLEVINIYGPIGYEHKGGFLQRVISKDLSQCWSPSDGR
jgi:hypothetical protein